MPAFATHYFFAKDVYQNLNEDLKKRIDIYRSYYDLGAQGPDIFFFYKPMKKNNIKSYGTSIHNKSFKPLLSDGCEKIKEYHDEGALMYLLGLVSHFILDNAFHPIIDARTKNFNEHMKLETELDRAIILKYSKHEPEKFRRHYLINISKKYASQLSLVYPYIDKKYLEEAVYQTEFYMRQLYSPKYIKGHIIEIFLNRFASNNNFSNMIIKKEVNTEFDKTIKILLNDYDKVVDRAVLLFENVLAYYNNDEKLDQVFFRNFNK